MPSMSGEPGKYEVGMDALAYKNKNVIPSESGANIRKGALK